MTPEQIRAAIADSPQLLALVPNTEALAAALSTGRKRRASHFASERGILERFPGGPIAADALLSKLEAFSSIGHPMSSIVKRALKFLAQAEGLDIGSPATQGLLDALQAGSVLTADEVAGVKAMALVDDPVTEFEVRVAIFADDGTLRV